MKKIYWIMICSLLCIFSMTLCSCDDEIADEVQITVNHSISKSSRENCKKVTFTATVKGTSQSNVEKILLNIRTETMREFVATISEGKLTHSHAVDMPVGTKGDYFATVFINNGKNIRTEIQKFEIE